MIFSKRLNKTSTFIALAFLALMSAPTFATACPNKAKAEQSCSEKAKDKKAKCSGDFCAYQKKEHKHKHKMCHDQMCKRNKAQSQDKSETKFRR